MASEHSTATSAVIARDFLPLAIVVAPLLGLIAGVLMVIRNGGEGSVLSDVLLLSVFFNFVSGLGLWFWLGRARWPVRVAGMAVGIAILERAAIAVVGSDQQEIFVWIVLAPTMVSYVVVAVTLRAARCRMKLVPARFTSGLGPHVLSGPVFSIADMLLWAIGAGALFAVARSTPPKAAAEALSRLMDFDVELVLMSLGCVSCAVGSVIALWCVFGTSRLAMRILALFLGVAVAGWLITGSFAWYLVGAQGWLVPIEVVPFVWLQGVIVAAGLCVFRACGYRLIRVHRVSEATPPQSELSATRPLAAPAFGLNHSPVGS